jgi:NAD(P)H-dependent FMN reductase
VSHHPIKILALSGSLQAGSTNTALLRAASALAAPDVAITIYTGLADLPHFNPELDGDSAPATVTGFREQLRAADAVLISTPEYVFAMPGSLKNAFDWVVGSGEFVNKPVALISASPLATGGSKALEALDQVIRVMSAQVVGSLSVPFARKKLNEQGELAEPQTIQALTVLVNDLVQHVMLNPTE